jgi:hypothetical protein
MRKHLPAGRNITGQRIRNDQARLSWLSPYQTAWKYFGR